MAIPFVQLIRSRTLLLFTLLYCFTNLPTQAQVVFNHVLGETNCYVEAFTMLPAANDGYLVSAAYNCAGGAANWKGRLLRLDGNGDTLWTLSDMPVNGFLRKSADGNYLFIGGNHAGLAYDTIVIYKANDQGDTIWTRHLFFPECNNLAYDLVNTRDGGYALCGIYGVNCTTAPTVNSFVTKLSVDGAVEWTTFLTGAVNTELFEIRQAANGNYALFGWTDSRGAGLADSYLVMLNEQGDSIFSKTYGTGVNDYGYGMDMLPDGSFITIGYSDSTYIRKLDAAGNLQWTKSIGVPSGSVYFKAVYTHDKHFAFIGCQNDTDNGGICSATLYKTDTNGNLDWQKNFGGLFRELTTDGPGTFLMAGYYGVFPSKPGAYYVRFDTTYNPMDTVTVGIDEPIVHSEISLSPNPVQHGRPIVFTAITKQPCTIQLFDLLGHMQASTTGTGTLALNNTSQLASGLYIWRARVGERTYSGKVVVQ